MYSIKSLYIFSACMWLLFGVYLVLSVQRFIVKRYEQETPLSKMRFFNEYLSFTKALPAFFKSSIYTCHLILFVWGWKIIKRIKKKKRVRYYDDIETPEDVLKYFSTKEIRRVKLEIITLMIITVHVIGMDILESLWPRIFD